MPRQRPRTTALILSLMLVTAVHAEQTPELSSPELGSLYLGQTPPGQVASIFAPDLVSVTGRYEFALSFAPAGDRLLFTAQVPDQKVMVHQSRLRNGRWTQPEPVSLAAGARKDEMESFFAPDGRHVYFAPYDEGMDVRIWRVTVDGDHWRDPEPLAGPIADDAAFFPTCAADGTLYYTNLAQRSVYRARKTDAGTWDAEPAGLEFGGHPFIAPDQSFVLLDGRAEDSLGKGDIYAAFPDGDGGWTTPVNLGPRVNSAHGESCPSLSADGKYLFFSRYDEPGDIAQIYWVDAAVIATARDIAIRGEPARIERIVRDSIAWALTKDRHLLESIIAHDDDYTCFHPEGLVPVRGYDQFEGGFDLWMDDRFVATRTDVRDFHCHISNSGDVAWFAAILDDCFTWDGQPGCWADTRWTGVLEKQDGAWSIMQMHFSFAADRDAAASD